MIDDLRRDIRRALRLLMRNPAFAGMAIVTLAAGIGASTATFSALRGVLLRPLPIEKQDEVVALWTEAPARGAAHLYLSYQDLIAFQEQSRTFARSAGVIFQGSVQVTLQDPAGDPLTTGATWVTGDFFSVLGVTPAAGRNLTASDDVIGAAPVMVVSHAFWQRRLGGSPAAIGRQLEMNGKPFTVVGVMPAGFEYPRATHVWFPVIPAFPATIDPSIRDSPQMIFDVVARLGPGVSIEQAREEVDGFLEATDAQRSPQDRGARAVITPLAHVITGDSRPILWAAFAAVGLLLLIACLNVGNLLLIRGLSRTQELIVRRALGADRSRLVRELLTENALLAAAGGVLGMFVAFWLVQGIRALAPAELPRRDMIAVDPGVLLFALLVTAGTAVGIGLIPAILSVRGDSATWVRTGRSGASGGRSMQTIRHALVVCQVSLAVLVVLGAGLLVRSLVALERVDMGFSADRVLVVETTLSGNVVLDSARQATFAKDLLARVKAVPGVVAVAAAPKPPFSGTGGWFAPWTGEGQDAVAHAGNPMVNFEVVSAEYFRVLEIPLKQGRVFDQQDRAGSLRTVIASEAVARRAWPNENPVGKRLKLGPPDAAGEWYTVVGVVGETRYWDLRNPRPSLYFATEQFGGPMQSTLLLRTRGEPASIVPSLTQALHVVHPALQVANAGSMRSLMGAPLAQPRFGAAVLGVFAAVTLLLAAVGIFGVLAASVRQRSHEISVRLALGATGRDMRSFILWQGMRLILIGSIIGLTAALVGTRLLASLLFGVTATDPVTYAGVILLMLGAGVLACYPSAQRASRLDPLEALRSE